MNNFTGDRGLPARNDTKGRILQAAERLFATRGYHNTSLRTITAAARVNLAAVNYHFGSKKALLEAVFTRRLIPLNQLRRQRLARVVAAAGQAERPPAVEEILRAFIEPTLKFHQEDPNAPYFITLVSRSFTEPDDTVREIFLRHVKPLGMYLFKLLCEAMPQRAPEIIFWRLQFVIGSLGRAMQATGQLSLAPPPGMNLPRDADSLVEILLPFLTAGMEAP